MAVKLVSLTAGQCSQLASDYKVLAKAAGISEKRRSILSNIAHSYSALSNQLGMLADDIAQRPWQVRPSQLAASLSDGHSRQRDYSQPTDNN
jgi:hypothetical protein